MNSAEISFRPATEADLPEIVALLVNDPLGAARERSGGAPAPSYVSAFRAIQDDANHEIIVPVLDGSVVGVLQLSFIPHLTYEGGWRAQIEGVRVSHGRRGRGVGKALIEWAIAMARDRGCHLVQLTTDQRRPEALSFYLGLGFEATHHGLKLHFDP